MRILLIDDEPVALAKLELMLGSIGDCETAASGIQATERFVKAISDNQPYDLVTIDIELPVWNSWIDSAHWNRKTASRHPKRS
jgi:two-component system chemotaxis response regulator CheY